MPSSVSPSWTSCYRSRNCGGRRCCGQADVDGVDGIAAPPTRATPKSGRPSPPPTHTRPFLLNYRINIMSYKVFITSILNRKPSNLSYVFLILCSLFSFSPSLSSPTTTSGHSPPATSSGTAPHIPGPSVTVWVLVGRPCPPDPNSSKGQRDVNEPPRPYRSQQRFASPKRRASERLQPYTYCTNLLVAHYRSQTNCSWGDMLPDSS